MTSIKMAEASKSSTKRRHALRNSILTGGGLTATIAAAVTLLNQSPAGMPPAFSPAAGLLIAAAALIGFVAVTYVYIKRTDEHDLLANLWALSLGSLFFVIAAPIWWILDHSGLMGPVNFWALYYINALIAGLVWGWLRFR